MLNPDTWLQQISLTSPLGFALVALAGLIMGVAPSSLPLASVIAGYVGRQAHEQEVGGVRKGLMLSAGFILGLATVDAAIGILFGFSASLRSAFSPVPWPLQTWYWLRYSSCSAWL